MITKNDIIQEIKRHGKLKKYRTKVINKMVERIKNPPCKFDYSNNELMQNTFDIIPLMFKRVNERIDKKINEL